MKAYVITIRDYDYSESCADRCILTGKRYGVKVEKWDAVPQDMARRTMESYGLQWTWPNLEPDECPVTKLKRFPYATRNSGARIGCAMSHYELWLHCMQVQEPIMILEHDAVFVRPMLDDPLPSDFGAIMLNNPSGATPKGGWWAQQTGFKGQGYHPKTVVFEDGRPDGLAGNSAYIISPEGAEKCYHNYRTLGVWPNDATLCRQLVKGLYETYPFVTEARQTRSTSGGY